jgi:hypothetical protein
MATYMHHHLPLTPESPLLPTSLPHVCEPIPPLPMTPPDADEVLDAASNEAALRTGLHVISTAKDAVEHMWELLHSDPVAQEGFMSAVNTITKTIHRGGKIVVSGIGKSGKIAEKVVATLNSFAIRSVFLHPTEALHGDLGIIAEVSHRNSSQPPTSSCSKLTNFKHRTMLSSCTPSRDGPTSYPRSSNTSPIITP